MSLHLSKFNVFQGKRVNTSQKNLIDNFFSFIVPKAEKEGVQIIVISGAMGSGKSAAVQFINSILMLAYPNMVWAIGRISIQNAIDTYMKEIKQMLPAEVMEKDTIEYIKLKNGSNIKAIGWGDGHVSKLRANQFSAAIIDEVTEDAGKAGTHELNKRALLEIFGRVRVPGSPRFIFLITNPDDPEHWLYREYISKASYIDGKPTNIIEAKKNVHVFYSVTSDNIFLGQDYIDTMLTNLSPKEAERRVYGRWVSVSTTGIYNEYKDELHYFPNEEYKVNKNYPITLAWDFNTAKGKPMSACIGQYINDHFHMYDEVVLENSNTRGVLEELYARGFFKQFTGTQELWIMGDAAGWAKHSSSVGSDYGVMKQFLDTLEYRVNYSFKVPVKNPEVKVRHNIVNAYLKNLKGDIRVKIYKGCETLSRGLKTAQLKSGSKYTEDDSNPTQHISSCFGYMVVRHTRSNGGVTKIN
jgi:PBSX family phage terminase large subunit